MGHIGFYVRGDWNAQCDQCGVYWKASQLRKRWDNAMVCRKCWERRNPQDFVRGIPDKQAPAWTRPPNTDVFVGGTQPSRLIDGSLIGRTTIG